MLLALVTVAGITTMHAGKKGRNKKPKTSQTSGGGGGGGSFHTRKQNDMAFLDAVIESNKKNPVFAHRAAEAAKRKELEEQKRSDEAPKKSIKEMMQARVHNLKATFIETERTYGANDPRTRQAAEEFRSFANKFDRHHQIKTKITSSNKNVNQKRRDDRTAMTVLSSSPLSPSTRASINNGEDDFFRLVSLIDPDKK